MGVYYCWNIYEIRFGTIEIGHVGYWLLESCILDVLENVNGIFWRVYIDHAWILLVLDSGYYYLESFWMWGVSYCILGNPGLTSRDASRPHLSIHPPTPTP